MNTRTGKTVAVLCVAVVVFSAFVPALAASLPPIILTALWLVMPATAVGVIRSQTLHCDEQPVSLLSLVLSRAPPLQLA